MTNMQIKTWAILLAVAGAAGCQSEPSTAPHEAIVHGEKFYPDDAPRDVWNFRDAQIAVAARADSTLYRDHFAGGELNSLGRDKLSSMLKDGDAALPLVVYLDMPKDTADLAAKQDAIATFLKDAGMGAEQFKVKVGPNLDYGYPAAVGLKALASSDQGGSSGAPAGPMTSSH